MTSTEDGDIRPRNPPGTSSPSNARLALDTPPVASPPPLERGSAATALAMVEEAIPRPESIPRAEIPDLVLAVGVLQSRLSALQAALAARSLGLAGPVVEEPDRWLSVEEVAARLGASTSWLYKRWRTELPFGFRHHGKLVFPAGELSRYLKARAAVGRRRSATTRTDLRRVRTSASNRSRGGTVLSWPRQQRSTESGGEKG